MAALEVYIRRSYQAYDLTQMQHDQVSPVPVIFRTRYAGVCYLNWKSRELV